VFIHFLFKNSLFQENKKNKNPKMVNTHDKEEGKEKGNNSEKKKST